MLHKIALEEAWSIPESLKSYDPGTLAPKGVIGGDLLANLQDVHGTRLKQMDENGIDMMALSLSSPGAQGVADPAAAEKLASLANDRLEEEVLKAPTRFSGFVAVSMHNPAQAAGELERCFKQKQGFVGVMLNDFQSSGSDGNKMLFYDQPEYDAFWGAAEGLGAPVYIHPRAATQLIHEQMWKDRPWLEFSALGYANRVNMHLLGIITAGVLDRFPKLKLVVGHMGEHMSVRHSVITLLHLLTECWCRPYDLYRIDHKLNRARFAKMPMRKDRLIRSYFGTQVFITTSGHFSTAALICALTEIGSDSIMFSIDYPFESIPNGSVWWDEHVKVVIHARELVKMGRNNALEIFPRLKEGPHAMEVMDSVQCEVGGLKNPGEVEFGLYNRDWDKRLKKQ